MWQTCICIFQIGHMPIDLIRPYYTPHLLNSLFGGEVFVEGSGRGHLHDQHHTLCIAEAQHANDEGVVQLVHDLCLSHHLLLHHFFIFILQHFNSHVDLTPETKQTEVSTSG